MGGSQSSGRDTRAGEQAVKTSYYELLGVQRQATDEEIKKAYRRKALELHPDRNYGSEEAATRIFAEVQAAYEVLSDPQERAWYDSHESAILRGDQGSGQDEAPAYQNIRITTADDLARMLRKFNSNVEFTDSPSGFFGFLRETFAQLAKEEEVAADWESVEADDYPTFGHKDDTYNDVVKSFYSKWMNFSTCKSFSWKDKHRLSEAPDRWYRRRMEQENKAYRKEGVKEFNEAVRAFVAFVRKRDPRYVPSTQSEAERQKILRDSAASQAARARAANQAKLDEVAVPEWTKTREPEELEESEEEEVEQVVFECVACNKVFKSEKQWETHEKSKKHQKAVYALQKKMRKENAHLDLNDSQLSSGVATPDIDEEELDVSDDLAAEVEEHEAGTNGHAAVDLEAEGEDFDDADRRQDIYQGKEFATMPDPDTEPPRAASDGDRDSEDSDYASPETIQARLQSASLDTPPTTNMEVGEETILEPTPEEAKSQPPQPKMGKAAQKRAKKAATAAATEESKDDFKCTGCSAAFSSKTKLFDHLRDHPKHAALKSVPSSGIKGKKSKSKR